MPTRRTTILATTAVALAATVSFATAQETIKIGQTMPYSGPASAYGQIGATQEACFEMINDQGGVNGRRIEFISLDDAYSPPKTVEQTRKLVESEDVLFSFQNLGTPTNSAVHKYYNQKQVPQLFVATGASKWGQPEEYPWTMGWQPNYQTEANIYAQYIKDNLPDAKIAVLYQNDDYGKDYLEGFKEGLGDMTGQIVAELPYEVADPTVDSQIISAKASGADVFFNITTPKFAAQAIKKAHEIGWKPTHFLNNVSISVGAVLEPAGFEASTGQMDPTDNQWHDNEEYKDWVAFMDEYHPDGDKTSSFTSYGYAACKTLEKVLEQAGDDLSRENIMKQAANLQDVRVPMLLPGINISTSPSDFYPIESMQLSKFNGKNWELFGDIISVETGGS
jgi:branched-chain amino acid transport system substrate-binding protein